MFKSELRFLMAIIISALIGYNIGLTLKLMTTRAQLETYQEMVADPHHCVSVVVEALEAQNEE